MPKFGFCGPTYEHRSTFINSEKCINLYPEAGPNKAGKLTLIGTPGLTTFATLPDPVRAVWAGDNIVYAVAGNLFYSVTMTGTVTLRGITGVGTTPAKIVSNGNELMIVSGDDIFVDSGAGPVARCTDGYVSGTFLDGYFIVLRNPTPTNTLTRDSIEISGLFDGTTWDPTDTQERQGSSDRLVQIIAHNQQLWLFGQETTEVWYNSGNVDFPFERIPGSQIMMGAWPWTIAELDHSLFYVGTNSEGGAIVYRTRGFIPQRVSNHAVEHAMRNVGPAVTPVPQAYTYQEEGHAFYVLCLPNETWVYDATTEMWHQRAQWNGSVFTPHDGVCAAHLYKNNQVIGSGSSGKLYVQSLDIPTYNGAIIRRYRQAPYIHDEAKRIIYHRLQLDIETGTQVSGTPTALLKYSSDGGKTFTADKSVTLGATGAYKKRAIWRRLGADRGRVFGVTLPDLNGPCVIAEAYVKATECAD